MSQNQTVWQNRLFFLNLSITSRDIKIPKIWFYRWSLGLLNLMKILVNRCWLKCWIVVWNRTWWPKIQKPDEVGWRYWIFCSYGSRLVIYQEKELQHMYFNPVELHTKISNMGESNFLWNFRKNTFFGHFKLFLADLQKTWFFENFKERSESKVPNVLKSIFL